MPVQSKITQNTVILDGGVADFRRLDRTSKSGIRKSRYAITLQSDPILFDFRDENLGPEVADEIRAQLSHQIQSITAQVSPATQRRRRALERAFARGEKYALRRFGGGRTGTTPPQQGRNQFFNHSRRLAKGLFVRQVTRERAFFINVPANRLSTQEFSEQELREMFRLLKQHVPGIRNPASLIREPEVKKAIRESIKSMIGRARDRNAFLRSQRLRALASAVGLRGLGFLR